MVEPPGTSWQGSSARPGDGRVPRRWLALARSAWIVCVLLLLANFVASIPAYYQIMRTICTLPNQVPCTMPGVLGNASAQLTPNNVAAWLTCIFPWTPMPPLLSQWMSCCRCCIFVDLPHRTICATLVLAHHPAFGSLVSGF